MKKKKWRRKIDSISFAKINVVKAKSSLHVKLIRTFTSLFTRVLSSFTSHNLQELFQGNFTSCARALPRTHGQRRVNEDQFAARHLTTLKLCYNDRQVSPLFKDALRHKERKILRRKKIISLSLYCLRLDSFRKYLFFFSLNFINVIGKRRIR